MTRLSLPVLLVGALLFGGAPTSAQERDVAPATWDFSVREARLSVALGRLVERTGMDLVYEAALTRGRKASCERSGATAEELLDCILRSAGLAWERLPSGTYAVVDPPPEVGRLIGLVVDGLTGRPVAWAEVELAGGRRTTSNASGHFLLTDVPGGRLEITATRIGYARTAVLVDVPAGGVRRTTLPLAPSAVRLEPVVVRGVEARAAASSRGAARVELGEETDLGMVTAGVSAAAVNATGVRTSPFAADLLVQGSEAGQNPVLLDGVPIFEPLSLGRSRSAFSPLALQEARVRKAGFAASGGSFIAGALEVEHAYATGLGGRSVTATVDPYAVNLRFAAPVSGGIGATRGRQGGVMVAGRVGLWDLYQEPSLNRALRDWNSIDPVLTRRAVGDGKFFTDGLVFDPRRNQSSIGFTDLHAALRLPVGGFSRLEASLYRGGNRVDTEVFAEGVRPSDARIEQVLLTRDDYEWENLGGQLSLHGLVGTRGAYRLRARSSLHALDHRYDLAEGSQVGFEPGGPGPSVSVIERLLRNEIDARGSAADANRIAEYAIEGRLDLALSDAHRLLVGTEIVRVESQVFLSDPSLRPLVSRLGHWRGSAFIEDRWSLMPGLDLELGARATRLSEHSESWIEPRIALEARGDALGGWSTRVAGGVYRQFVNRFELSTLGPSALVPSITFWLPTDRTVTPPRARHLAAELALTPAPGWELRAESWWKSLDRVLDLDYRSLLVVGDEVDEVDQEEFVAEADGRAWGFGLRATRRFEAGTVHLGYERSVSERTYPGRFEGDRQPVASNLPHLLFGGLDARTGGGVGVRIEARAAWERSWALRRAYYDYLILDDDGDGPTLGHPDDDRLPALIEIDVGVRWGGELSGTRIEAQLMIKNLLHRENVLDRSLRRDPTDEEQSWSALDRVLPGITPLVTLRILP